MRAIADYPIDGVADLKYDLNLMDNQNYVLTKASSVDLLIIKSGLPANSANNARWESVAKLSN